MSQNSQFLDYKSFDGENFCKKNIYYQWTDLNLLGTREPEKYGKTSLKDIELLCFEKMQNSWI